MPSYKTHITYKKKFRVRHDPVAIIAAVCRQKFAQAEQPVLIAVGGPGGTGKSTFAQDLAAALSEAAVFMLDDYKTPRAERAGKNIFGAHPQANNMALVQTHLEALKQGEAVSKPVYNARTGQADNTKKFNPQRYVIVDGEISTYPQFHERFDLSIFIDADWKTQLKTRITRDIESRGYNREKAIQTFLQSNLREFSEYGAESKMWSDIHIFVEEPDHRLVIESVAAKLYSECHACFEKEYMPLTISGLIVPITTPFRQKGPIDETVFVEHISFLAEVGVTRLLIAGTTGEFFSLTREERRLLLRLARRYFPGVIIYHASSCSLAATRAEIDYAQKYGADAVMVLPPYYYAAVHEAGAVQYLQTLAAGCRIPFFLYNYPANTNVAISATMLVQIPHAGLKDAAANLALAATAKAYFIGSDTDLEAARAQGAVGFVSGLANVFPELYVDLEDGFKQGKAISQTEAVLRGLAVQPPDIEQITWLKQLLGARLATYPNIVRLPLIQSRKNISQQIAGIMARFQSWSAGKSSKTNI